MAHKYAVIKATNRHQAIDIDGRVMAYGEKSGGLFVKDSGLAAEIEARYEKHGDAVVIRQPVREPGHRYTFAVPELPWKRTQP